MNLTVIRISEQKTKKKRQNIDGAVLETSEAREVPYSNAIYLVRYPDNPVPGIVDCLNNKQ